MKTIVLALCVLLSNFLSPKFVHAEAKSSPPLFQEMQQRIQKISSNIKPKVVYIEAILKVDNMSMRTSGSGIIADREGHILTNHHVVEKAEKVTVKIPGEKKKYLAEIIGTDKQTDLAVLKIKPDRKLTPPPFGNSSQVEVGDWVVAIGNPYGLDGTVSFGIISAIQRNLNVGGLLNEFIQTDAMIDFGSSGGPLVNMRGEVIGINSRGQGRGIGFTIPINTALENQKKLIQEGQVERAWLGISIQPLDRDLAEYLGFPKVTGIIINQVHEGSSAEKAGLKAGDILTHFDRSDLEAETLRELRSVTRKIAHTPVGKKVKIKVIRNQKQMTLTAKLQKQPQVEGLEEESELGFHVQEITKILFISRRLLTRKGVYVSFVEPGSIAGEAKLFRGDVIQKIDKHHIKTLEDFTKLENHLENQKRTLLQVKRGNELIFILLKNDRKKPRRNRAS